MSGGITQLVAIGAQDAHIVGKPEVSFFRSNYKRHTNFAQNVERQVIQGAQAANGMSTIRFERKGDLLSYVYFTARNTTTSQAPLWSRYISKVELLIGGQVIDDQSFEFMDEIAPDVLAQNLSRCPLGSHYAGGGTSEWFFPLRFWFCENYQSALPLVALQYHDVELRITWDGTDFPDAPYTVECYANFISLDNDERQALAEKPLDMLIYQVQKAVPSSSRIQELNFNHPVKFLASPSGGAVTSSSSKIKLQINGVDLAEEKLAKPNYTLVASYYHSPFAVGNADDFFMYPFCLDTSKHQPTGSLNFSRIDTARLVSDNENFTQNIYGLNLNILRIQNGMGGLMYAN
jgi:hypothetical protein